MNYSGHLIVALLVSYIIYALINSIPALSFLVFPVTPVAIGLVAFGALLPDVDTFKSKAFRICAFLAIALGAYLGFKQLGYLGILIGAVIAIALIAIYTIIKPRHRGITHSLAAAVAYGLLAGIATASPGIGLVSTAAYASHLLADKL